MKFDKDTRIIKLDPSERQGNFTIIPNSCFDDMNHSHIGLYAYLLRQKPNTETKIEHVAKNFFRTKNSDTARKYLEAIKTAGYALGSCQTGNYVVLEFNINDVDEDTRNKITAHVQSLARRTQRAERTERKKSNNSSKRGDILLDVFGGGGTAVIIAEMTGRRARVIEIDPWHCDVIVQRFEDFTGQEVTRATGPP